MPLIEIHSAEIKSLYNSQFARCCALAETIDVIANEMIEDRKLFENYLEEFDSYLAQVKNYTSNLTRKLNSTTDGHQAFSVASTVVDIGNYSVRAVQIIMTFAAADETIRHASYGFLKGKMAPEVYDRIVTRVAKEMTQTIRGMTRIHDQCIAKANAIMDQRQHDYNTGKLTTAELTKSYQKRLRRQRIDPSRPAFPATSTSRHA